MKNTFNKIKFILIMTTLIALFAATCNQAKETQAAPEKLSQSANRYWNDLARYLAGLEPEKDSVLSTMDNGALAQKHRKFFKNSWQSESNRLSEMAKWRAVELKDIKQDQAVFYPFSGPDFINIATLYPDGKKFVLFGLEKPGTPPDITQLSPKEQEEFLSHVQKSLASILRWSFFRTLSMKRDFNNKSLDGLNPILLAFISRMGNRVLDVTSIRIGADAKLYGIYNDNPHPPKDRVLPEYVEQKSKFTAIPGIRIRFQKEGQDDIQELIFLSFNVSDEGLKTYGQFPEFVKSHCPCNTYLKAASYLMHNDSFSNIRNTVLGESEFLLEDDSGIPLKYFKSNVWDLTFYGRYHTPIPLFKNRVQQDLRNAYKKQGAKKLPFGIGYNYAKGTSNLLAARKKPH